MAAAIILLSLVFMYFTAGTVAIERTLRALVLLVGDSEKAADAESHTEVRIILGMQLTWMNAAFLLGMGVYLVTARASAWYYGVLLVALCLIGSALIGSTTSLRPGSPKTVAVIASGLERRRESYRYGGDGLRFRAIERLLGRLRSLPRSQIATGGNR